MVVGRGLLSDGPDCCAAPTPKAPALNSRFVLTESVDDLMAGHFYMETIDKYTLAWVIERHLVDG